MRALIVHVISKPPIYIQVREVGTLRTLYVRESRNLAACDMTIRKVVSTHVYTCLYIPWQVLS